MKIEHASWSGLKHFAKSPKHYLNYLEEKGRDKTEPMLRGLLTHCLILEPKELNKKFLIVDKFDRRSKDAKQKWADLQEEAKETGRDLVFTDLVNMATALKNAVVDSPAKGWIQKLDATEVKTKWLHHSGINVLSYIDGVGPNFFLELKTCQDADPRTFPRKAFWDGYIHQVALYHQGLIEKFSTPLPCILVAVEAGKPYGVSVHKVSTAALGREYPYVNGLISEFADWAIEQENAGYEYKSYKGYFEYEYLRS